MLSSLEHCHPTAGDDGGRRWGCKVRVAGAGCFRASVERAVSATGSTGAQKQQGLSRHPLLMRFPLQRIGHRPGSLSAVNSCVPELSPRNGTGNSTTGVPFLSLGSVELPGARLMLFGDRRRGLNAHQHQIKQGQAAKLAVLHKCEIASCGLLKLLADCQHSTTKSRPFFAALSRPDHFASSSPRPRRPGAP